jgi:hypothetical protein
VGPSVPITPFLGNREFDAETRRVMSVAFEMTRAALRLAHSNDAMSKIVADKIIELAESGERNPNVLCERTLSSLRAHER